MKRRGLGWIYLIAFLLAFTSAVYAQSPPVTSSTEERIVITADGIIPGYRTFTQGTTFSVLVLSPLNPATESTLGARGFDQLEISHQGNNLLVSFRLSSVAVARVHQRANVLEILIRTTNQPSVLPLSPQDGVTVGSVASSAERNGETQPISAGTMPRNSEQPTSGNSTGNRTEGLSNPTQPATEPKTVAAQTQSVEEEIKKANKIGVVSDEDLATPESPAFTVLGLNPQSVVRPASPKEFSSALLNGVDEHGNFQTGLALDAVPFLVFAGDGVSLYDYNHNYLLRLLSRTQVSFATAKGTSENDKSVRLATGVHMTFWDRGDPRTDDLLFKCYDAVDQIIQPKVADFLVSTPGGVKSQLFPAFLASLKDEFTTKTNECDTEARKRNWKKTGFVIGAAPSWISPTGTTDKFRWNGGGFWASLAYGFEGVRGLEDNSQLIFHMRFRTNEQVPDPNQSGSFLTQDQNFFGTRLRIGNKDTNASFEGAYVRLKQKGQNPDNSYRYSLGLERRIAQNIWFQLSLGTDTGRRDGNNQAFVKGSFQWGFTRKQDPVSPTVSDLPKP